MSANTPSLPGFDYASLAPDVRANVETATRRLHELERRTSESIIEMGQHLIAVKEQLPHGQFLPWLDREFGWSERTAQRLMEVFERFKSANLADLGAISPSALYLLAAPSTPNDIQDAFTRLAELRQPVRHKDVQAAIAERKAPRRAEPIPVNDWDNDDEPEEVPYEIVDMRTGELSPPMSRNHSTSFAPTPPPQPSPETPDDRARRTAQAITEEYGREQARRIGVALLAIDDEFRGAA